MLVRHIVTILAMLALAAPAAAAPTVPRSFFGLTYSGEVTDAPDGDQARSWRLMAGNGAGSARTPFSWSAMQPDPAAAPDFSKTDRLVEYAARRRLVLLPVITSTPMWARADPQNWWPREAATFASFVDAAVRRYGRGGSFWADHPDVPRRPVAHWQLYNEPNRSEHYPPLLRAGYRAVKAADGRGKVVLAGITGAPHDTPWEILAHQYRKGKIRRWFDVAALHMYTGRPENVLEGVRRFRTAMRRNGDGRKPLWVTEFGITASRGRTDAPDSQRTLRTTDRGMARFLEKAYALLAKNRRRDDIRLGRAYWFTWASSYERGTGIFSFAGLNRYANGRLEAKPALAAFRRSARRHRAG